jgi:hypothetical protein
MRTAWPVARSLMMKGREVTEDGQDVAGLGFINWSNMHEIPRRNSDLGNSSSDT